MRLLLILLLALSLVSCHQTTRAVKVLDGTNTITVMSVPNILATGDTISVVYNTYREEYVIQQRHLSIFTKAVILR